MTISLLFRLTANADWLLSTYFRSGCLPRRGLTARFGYQRSFNLSIIAFMQIPFQITALPIEQFTSLFSKSDEDLESIGVRRMVADQKPGYPCRVSLVDAEPGEEVLLVPFTHHEVNSPYRATGPIFVRVEAQTARLEINEVPPMIRTRLLSIRGYDAAGMMLLSEVLNGAELEEHLWRFFADPRVAYIDLHNARPGCYNCRVERARPQGEKSYFKNTNRTDQ